MKLSRRRFLSVAAGTAMLARMSRVAKIEDLVNAAIVYARIAMDLCNQDRPRGLPLGCHVNAAIAAEVQKRAKG